MTVIDRAAATNARSAAHSADSGTVYLVGAGPGDPGLLTLRALELLRCCDDVVHDALANPALLEARFLGRESAPVLHFVGKRGGARSTPQTEINALLVHLARQGRRVVRLKGGDPLVFGRGSEEAQALAAEGIPFEIIPGITAGIAAPAYAGIPVTHRHLTTTVTFVTGHEDPGKGDTDTDWTALARVGGTLVLYMGVRRLAEITTALIAGGMHADTPVGVIEWGTYPTQRTVIATLGTIVERVTEEGVSAPAITVVGDVVRVRDEIAWFDRRPLHGRRIVVTRARTQASELSHRLRSLGADVIEVPAIRIEPLDPAPLGIALDAIAGYRWILFTSRNAVAIVWDALRRRGADARALAGVRICAVGPGTAAELMARGINADVIPERFVGEGVAEALSGEMVQGTRVLFPKAAGARERLPDSLREKGAQVDEIAIYRSVPDGEGAATLRDALARGEIDFVTYTSSSTVKHFVEAVGLDQARRARGASIGPITTATARELGLMVDVEADEATIAALVDVILRAANR